MRDFIERVFNILTCDDGPTTKELESLKREWRQSLDAYDRKNPNSPNIRLIYHVNPNYERPFREFVRDYDRSSTN